jgi:phospholipid-transporting ATPase
VITLSALKDFLEDRKRKKSDREENESVVYVANRDTQSFEIAKWEELRVGDIVKVPKNHPIPADLFLLGAFEKNGEYELVNKVEQCYV